MARSIPDITLSNVSAFLAKEMGLFFPRDRWDDLERGLLSASRELGFMDVQECLRWLLSAPLTRRQIETLAGSLTIGETYFFRDPRTLETTELEILPALLQERRGRDKRLRIWSAGCSTGEEPYTLAILLHRLLPDIREWNITILATDINTAALKKGIAGIYGKWSFRATPSWFKTMYFTPQPDGTFKVADNVRRMVSFEYLNLAQDSYPSLPTNTNAMDLIFCRNVIMYFSPEMGRMVVGKLHKSLIEQGWLILGPAETLPRSFTPLEAVSMGGVVCYRKRARGQLVPEQAYGGPATARPPDETGEPAGEPGQEPASIWQGKPQQLREAAERVRQARMAAEATDQPAAAEAGKEATHGEGEAADLPESSCAQAAVLFRQGFYPQATAMLAGLGSTGKLPPEGVTMLIRAQANQGKLGEALELCDEALRDGKLDPALHVLRAEILQEQGRGSEAMQALQRALYLDPKLVLAHFALGNLTLWSGSRKRACRHFGNALKMLQELDPEAVVPGSEGMTAARLREIIASMTFCAGKDGEGMQ